MNDNKRNAGNAAHPGWKLSRDCVRDTFLAKRAGVFRSDGTMQALCARTLQSLRATQLAPYIETKMMAGRFLVQIVQKCAAPEIVVVLRGGMVQAVCSTNAYTKVRIADHDIDDPDADEAARLEEAMARIERGDMVGVW